MPSRKEYIGRIAVKLADGSELEFSIYKFGRNIWLNDVLLPDRSSYSWGGIDSEIGQLYNSPVESRRWVENTGKPLF